MARYQVTLRCTACHHRYKRVLTAEDEAELAHVPDPPCPKCSQPQAAPRGLDLESGRVPAIGGSQLGRVYDANMEATMREMNMTDIKDRVYEGENSVPPLPPRMQAMADNMFKAPKRSSGLPGVLGMNPAVALRAAVGGSFRTPDTADPVAMQHAARDKPPVRIVNG